MLLTLLPLLIAAVSLVVALGVLCTIGQRVRLLSGRSGKHEAALQAESARLSAEIAELKTKVQEMEETGHSVVSGAMAAAPTNGVGNTLRSKVLKMHRLGQSPERIAGSLRLPQGEVDLLVKVHRIVMRPYQDVQLAPIAADLLEKV
jgi:hypothetical protein